VESITYNIEKSVKKSFFGAAKWIKPFTKEDERWIEGKHE